MESAQKYIGLFWDPFCFFLEYNLLLQCQKNAIELPPFRPSSYYIDDKIALKHCQALWIHPRSERKWAKTPKFRSKCQSSTDFLHLLFYHQRTFKIILASSSIFYDVTS